MSALPPKADMCGALGHVRFGPIADIEAYSITSSARCWKNKGTSRPSDLAVLALTVISYLIGSWTGSSAGLCATENEIDVRC